MFHTQLFCIKFKTFGIEKFVLDIKITIRRSQWRWYAGGVVSTKWIQAGKRRKKWAKKCFFFSWTHTFSWRLYILVWARVKLNLTIDSKSETLCSDYNFLPNSFYCFSGPTYFSLRRCNFSLTIASNIGLSCWVNIKLSNRMKNEFRNFRTIASPSFYKPYKLFSHSYPSLYAKR